MIRGIKFVGIPVRDQDRALRFWTETMGLKVETDQPMGDQRWIELRIPGAETRMVLFTPKGHEDRAGTFWNGSIASDDVEASFAAMTAKGVRFKAPPAKEPWGTFAIFLDSEDNEFVLSSR